MVQNHLPPSSFIWSIDFKKAYYNVPLSTFLSKLCCINFNNQSFRFTALPLGLSIAQKIFTRITSYTLQHIRSKGIKIFTFIDDSIGISDSYEQALLDIQLTTQIFTEAGYLINYEKSDLTPSKSLLHLGLNIDLTKMSFCLPDKKIIDLQNLAYTLAKKPRSRAQTIAKLAGKLISSQMAFWPAKRFAWPLITDLYSIALTSKTAWQTKICLSSRTRQDLLQLHSLQKSDFTRPILDNTKHTFSVQSDSSLSAYGLIIKKIHSPSKSIISQIIAHDEWNYNKQHINSLELQVPLMATHLIPKQSEPTRINFIIDNQVALSYLQKGGSNPSLQQTYIKIIDQCRSKNLIVNKSSWIASAMNKLPDYLSRLPRVPNNKKSKLILDYLTSLEHP